jgi:hypothetical protein
MDLSLQIVMVTMVTMVTKQAAWALRVGGK